MTGNGPVWNGPGWNGLVWDGQALSEGRGMPDGALLQIRPLEPEDAEAVARLEREIFGTPWSERTIRTSIAQAGETALPGSSGAAYAAFGAFLGERLAGYLFAVAAAGEGELHRIAVAFTFRRQNIGGALMKAFLLWISDHGGRGIWLEVRAGNEAAAALYKKHGFLEAGRRKRYYQNPVEDARIFTLQEIPSVYH